MTAGAALDPFWRAIDATTGYAGMSVAAAVLAGLLAHRGRRRDALGVAVAFLVTIGCTTLLKHLVRRPRPEDLPHWAEVSAFSLPSGHAAATAAVALCVVLLARGSRWLQVVALLLVAVAAWAQLAAGLHHPGDVLAGWLLAGAVCLVVRRSGALGRGTPG